MSQYNTFDIVTRLRDVSQGFEVGFLQDQEIYLFYTASRFSLDSTHSPVPCVSGVHSQDHNGRRVKPTTHFRLVPTSILHSPMSLYDKEIIKGKSNWK